MPDGTPAGGPSADPPVPPPDPPVGPPDPVVADVAPAANRPETPEACAACRRSLRPGAAFCGCCGFRVGDPAPPPSRPRESYSAVQRRVTRDWGEISFVIKFYVAMLAIQIVTALVIRSGAEPFTAYLVADALLAVAVGVAAAMHGSEMRALLVRPGFSPGLLAIVLGAALPVYAAVHAFVTALQGAFHLEGERILDDFAGRGFVWPLLLVCVNAAVFEELAFRGVIFGILRRHARLAETLLITSTAFAILHLSVFALVSHTLLGLYLGWLRHRSGSLYPCILAHFLHNALALADERWALLG
jgi:membrane protease YdiL (CAAX protease family)